MSLIIPPFNWGGVARSYRAAREPDIVYMFTVLVGGLAWGDFEAVTGIGKEVDTEQYPEGGRTAGPRQLIKGYKPGQVTLKWGQMDRTFMWDWIDTVAVGGGALGLGGGLLGFRREVTVVQCTRDHTPYRMYHFTNAFPVSLKAGDLVGQGQQSVEDLTLAYDTVTPLIIAQDLEATAANLMSAARAAMS